MSRSLPGAVRIDPISQDDIEMLEFALPIPSDQSEKLRALTYLHETIDYYIKDFCEGEGDRDIDLPLGEDRRRGPPPANPHSVTLPQAVQIFLTFYICLFI